MELQSSKSTLLGATFALVAMFAFQGAASAQVAFTSSTSADDVTYTRDVAPIIQQNCQVCHRPGGIGPMDLVTYDDARRYARRIREQVANRIMPPYYYDNDVGIQDLQHDWRLSDEQIATVVSWVDQGSVEGDPADLPVANLPDTEDWSLSAELGPPDIIVPSTPIDVPADGNDMWHRPIVPTGITEARCIKALQVKPAGNAKGVVHHANSTFQLETDNGSFEASGDRATEYAMGKLGELIPDGVCRTIPANAYVAWDIHLYPGGLGAAAPNDIIRDNVVELGIWLHPADYQYEYKQDLALYGIREGELLMPPNGTAMTQGFKTFDHPVRIDSFQPHGHLRMRSASLEILYPETGRVEVASMISNWSATWHQSHIYGVDSAPLVPAGAVLIMKQWYDNTSGNPNVQDPDMWVDDGSRTADEMSHAWIAVTHLDEEGYQKLLEEREAKQERRITDDD
jgi:mono/diheme cytochrome c family protein